MKKMMFMLVIMLMPTLGFTQKQFSKPVQKKKTSLSSKKKKAQSNIKSERIGDWQFQYDRRVWKVYAMSPEEIIKADSIIKRYADSVKDAKESNRNKYGKRTKKTQQFSDERKGLKNQSIRKPPKTPNDY